MTQTRPEQDLLSEVEAAIKARRTWLGFAPAIETLFTDARAEARRVSLGRLCGYGLIIYNSFLITDWFMLPDVFVDALVIQLGIVSPLIVVINGLMMRRLIEPDDGVTVGLIAIFIGIVVLCHRSETANAPFLVFTFPCCLLFGNVVLPLSFRRSLTFTGVCVVIGSASIFTVNGLDNGLRVFALLLFLNSAGYMIIATHRMEAGERLGFLFTLRETIQIQRLAENNRHLRNLSETDGLTGIGNRRQFDATLARLWDELHISGGTLGLVLIDIDHFKRLNDTFGHLSGDGCLKQVAARLDAAVSRYPDVVLARYGGEEFAVLVTNQEAARIEVWAERLRSAIADGPMTIATENGEMSVGITVSAGYAVAGSNSFPAPGSLIAAADEALYGAKRSGRNRVIGWAPQAGPALAAG